MSILYRVIHEKLSPLRLVQQQQFWFTITLTSSLRQTAQKYQIPLFSHLVATCVIFCLIAYFPAKIGHFFCATIKASKYESAFFENEFFFLSSFEEIIHYSNAYM